MQIFFLRHDIEDPPCEFHHAEGMLEPSMRGTWVDQVRHRQLVDVAESLKRATVEDFSLTRLDPDEVMDWIADFVEVFGHHPPSPTANTPAAES